MDRRRFNSREMHSEGDGPPGCCICFGGFTGRAYNDFKKDRVPLVLNCTHSSCENCILNCFNSNKPIVCAACNTVSPSPATEEEIKEMFPINKHLLGLCSKMSQHFVGGGDSQIAFPKKVVKREMPRKCFSSCTECTGPGNCFCESCRTNYCKPCFKKVHSAAKVLRNHKYVLSSEMVATVVKVPNDMCSVHHGYKLDFFCTPCSVSICSACLVSQHNGHNLQSIVDKNKELIDEIIVSYARVTDVSNIMKTSIKNAQRALKSSSGTSSNLSHEQRLKNHFLHLHAQLEIMESQLINKLNSNSRTKSLKKAIDQLSKDNDLISKALSKSKSNMKTESSSVLESTLRELRELENLPCVLVASEKETESSSLTIDESIFSSLLDHIVLKVEDAVTYQLTTENDAPDDALENLPKTCSLEEIKAQLHLPLQPIRPSSPQSGILPAEYAVEKSGRAVSPMISRWSSSSSVSSNNSFVIEATQLLTPPDDLVVGVTFQAGVSHITSPSDFYVQRSGARRKLESLQREMKRYGSNFSRKKNLVYLPGHLYMTLYEADFNWSRCQIVDFVGEDKVKVNYIDFGNQQTILKSHLKPLPDVLAQIAPMALRCSIDNCHPLVNGEWDPRVVTLMSRILEGRGSTSITIVRKNQLNVLTVKLYKETETNTIDVGEALVFLEYAQYGATGSLPQDIEKAANPKPYPAQSLLRLEDVKHKAVNVTYVASPDEFYITFTPTSEEFISLSTSLHRQYATTDKRWNDSRIVYYPAVGMAVAVPDENGFYRRGLVTEMLPNKLVKVFLVDDGPTCIVEWDKLRTLELKYFKLPPQAYRCSMSDIQPKEGQMWQEEAADLIKSFEGKHLMITNPVLKGIHTSIVLIHCGTEANVCVNALLVREGFAQSIGPYGSMVEYIKAPNLVTSSKPKVDKANEFKIVQRPNPQTQQVVVPKPKKEIKTVPKDDLIIKDPNGQLKLKVSLSKVVNPGEFYVTLDSQEEEYKIMNVDMNHFYNTTTFVDLSKKWELGEKCAVKLEDGSWKRGLVVEHSEDNHHVKVQLVDEVDTEVSVSLKTPGFLAELYPPFDKFVDRVFKCTLGGIVPAGSSSWTLTSISEMEYFLSTNKDHLYISSMKPIPGDSKNILRVLLLCRVKVKPTAVEPEYDEWTSLNHLLRWKGFAKPDQYTKWDHQGNIIGVENNNAMEDEQVVLDTLLRDTFYTTPEGKVDLSKPLSSCPEIPKITWLAAEPLENLTFTAKTTYIGSNCEVWIQDATKAAEKLNEINDEAIKLCEGTDPPNPPLNWEVGDICLARYHIDQKWYRSEILQVFATSCHHLVRFVDYGNEEFLDNNDLRLADGMTMRPIQAHICYFDNLAPIGGTWLASHIHEIHLLVVDKLVHLELRNLVNNLLGIQNMIFDDGTNALDEIVARRLGVYRSCPASVSELDSSSAVPNTANNSSVINSDSSTLTPCDLAVDELVPLEESAGLKSFSVINWLNLYETEDKYELPTGGFKLLSIPPEVNEVKVDITSILSSRLCMIQISSSDNPELESIATAYNELVNTMQQEAECQPCLEPPYLYKNCCGQFEGDEKWYRAVVIHDSSEEDGCLAIQFVDYGDVQKCQLTQVKQMKEEWFSVPVQSILCQIHGYKFNQNVSDSEAMVYLQRFLIDQPFVKAIIKKREKNLSVEFYNEEGDFLYQPLIDEHHLVPSSSC